MNKEEMERILKKMEIIDMWYSEITGAEYTLSGKRLIELILKLEEVK